MSPCNIAYLAIDRLTTRRYSSRILSLHFFHAVIHDTKFPPVWQIDTAIVRRKWVIWNILDWHTVRVHSLLYIHLFYGYSWEEVPPHTHLSARKTERAPKGSASRNILWLSFYITPSFHRAWGSLPIHNRST